MSDAAERCCFCDEPTGKAGAGDGSLYLDDGYGPFCERCFESHERAYRAAEAAAAARIAEVEKAHERECIRADALDAKINLWGGYLFNEAEMPMDLSDPNAPAPPLKTHQLLNVLHRVATLEHRLYEAEMARDQYKDEIESIKGPECPECNLHAWSRCEDWSVGAVKFGDVYRVCMVCYGTRRTEEAHDRIAALEAKLAEREACERCGLEVE